MMSLKYQYLIWSILNILFLGWISILKPLLMRINLGDVYISFLIIGLYVGIGWLALMAAIKGKTWGKWIFFTYALFLGLFFLWFFATSLISIGPVEITDLIYIGIALIAWTWFAFHVYKIKTQPALA